MVEFSVYLNRHVFVMNGHQFVSRGLHLKRLGPCGTRSHQLTTELCFRAHSNGPRSHLQLQVATQLSPFDLCRFNNSLLNDALIAIWAALSEKLSPKMRKMQNACAKSHPGICFGLTVMDPGRICSYKKKNLSPRPEPLQ